MNIHDSGYKFLFSNQTIFRQLIETFVDQPWVAQLDFSQAEMVDKSYVSDHYKETESDLIYRLPFAGGELYIYILLEFQSTVDPMMALRVLNYVTNFYMDLVKSGRNVRKLPPIFPIVLYNGDERWSAAEDISDLIEDAPDLGDYGLHYRYFKIAENEYSREQLLAVHNIVSTLFLSEAYYDIDLLADELMALFNRKEEKQAVLLFLNWFHQLSVHGKVDKDDYQSLEDIYRSREDVKSMLLTALNREKEEILRKGIERGIELGIARGIEQGRAEGEERNRKIVAAMLANGFSLSQIAPLILLSVEEVTRLSDLPIPNEADGAEE